MFPSIGGWTLSDNFPVMSADPVARNNFAKKCAEILTYHNFDGIDIGKYNLFKYRYDIDFIIAACL